ncbi:MAG TPA: hypothetical protein VF676_08700 [Flavobacterium sp.]|jgi:hypothetical protein
MKFKPNYILLLLLLLAMPSRAQHDADILKIILNNYYKKERIVPRGRTQFLFLYCDKANNNEQLFETIGKMKLSSATAAKLRKEVVADTKTEDWSADLEAVYASQPQLKSKINACLSLEEYQAEYKKRNVNNQRMMIVSKPLFYDANHAIVKVVFYRTIEHNSGSVVHLEKINNQWIIKEHLDPWST